MEYRGIGRYSDSAQQRRAAAVTPSSVLTVQKVEADRDGEGVAFGSRVFPLNVGNAAGVPRIRGSGTVSSNVCLKLASGLARADRNVLSSRNLFQDRSFFLSTIPLGYHGTR